MFANAIESNPAPSIVIFGSAFFIAILVFCIAMIITMELDLLGKWAPSIVSLVISVVGWIIVFNIRIEENYPISVLYWSVVFYALA